MKKILLIHNPGAGSAYAPKKLVRLIQDAGFKCIYTSSKDIDWNLLNEHIDAIAVAGGDGSVRKLAKYLLARPVLDRQYPIALLPSGTANNIGKTLELGKDLETIINKWDIDKRDCFDVGKVSGVAKHNFFLEGFGFGIFPNLMNEMKKMEKETKGISPQEEVTLAQKTLARLIKEYEPRECTLVVDGMDHSGSFILVEIMNTHSIGPNLMLNPAGNYGDGEFEIVLIPAAQRDKLCNYVEAIAANEKCDANFTTLRGRDIHIKWHGVHAHIDDEVIKDKNFLEVDIYMRQCALSFLKPIEK